MKIYSYYLIISFSIILCSSCDTIQKGPENLAKEDFRTITVDNNYTLDLPKYMSEGELHDDASLEYQHLFKETYAIIIDEDKHEADASISYLGSYNEERSIMENYIAFQMEGFEEGSEILDVSPTEDISIDGLPAKQFNMTLTYDDIDDNIFYLATFIESNNRMYMLLNWTLAGRKERYANTFKTIANSFTIQQRRSKTNRKIE